MTEEAVDDPGRPAVVDDGTAIFPVMPPRAALDKMLDDIDSTAVTGHTVVNKSTVSVIRTVLMPSGRLVREAVAFLPGQFVIVGAQLITVRVEVTRTVRVVRAAPADGAGEGTSVFPVTPSAAAADSMLEERASAAVTGQTAVVSWIVSVIRAVDTPSGRLVGITESAGQSVTVGAQLMTVWIDVVTTVIVVSRSPLSEATGVASPLDWVVGTALMSIMLSFAVDNADEL